MRPTPWRRSSTTRWPSARASSSTASRSRPRRGLPARPASHAAAVGDVFSGGHEQRSRRVNVTAQGARMPIETPPPGGTGLVVYQWMAWRGFLAARLFPAATPLHARFDDSVDAVLATIPP